MPRCTLLYYFTLSIMPDDFTRQEESAATQWVNPSLDLGLYSAGNYRTGHLPRRGLVDFTSSQISPITL